MRGGVGRARLAPRPLFDPPLRARALFQSQQELEVVALQVLGEALLAQHIAGKHLFLLLQHEDFFFDAAA